MLNAFLEFNSKILIGFLFAYTREFGTVQRFIRTEEIEIDFAWEMDELFYWIEKISLSLCWFEFLKRLAASNCERYLNRIVGELKNKCREQN